MNPTQAADPNSTRLRWLLVLLGMGGIVGLTLQWDALVNSQFLGAPFSFYAFDLGVYFRSSQWVVGAGRLYQEVPSEYPLLANLLFGVGRWLAERLHPFSVDVFNFVWVWLCLSWLLYLWAIYQILTQVERSALWLWLAPTTLLLGLIRYDLFPAVATLIALLALRQERYRRSALWLGLAIALKGYALFALPAYALYLRHQRGSRVMGQTLAIALTPFLLGNLIVLLYAGVPGLLSPYSFHALRQQNAESTYDALRYVLPFLGTTPAWLAQLLQVSAALFAAWLRPKTFEDLVDAWMVAIVGFMSFSIFYSPQFCLWVLPLASLQRSRLWAMLFVWVTFLYFPLAFVLRYRLPELAVAPEVRAFLFGLSVVVVTALRFGILTDSVLQLRDRRLKGSEI